MPRIIYSIRDVFSFKVGNDDGNYGYVISENEAILITVGDRSQGYLVAKGSIPETTVPIHDYPNGVPFQVQLVIKGANLMLSYTDSGDKLIDSNCITFSFEGISYRLDQMASGKGEITLPDGRILSVGRWLETFPPKPDGLLYLGKTVRAPMAVKV